MPPPGARGNHWEIEGTEGHLSGDQLTLYNDGGSYQIEDVYTEVDGEQVLDHVRIETSPPDRDGRIPFAKYKISASDDVAKASILPQYVSRRDV